MSNEKSTEITKIEEGIQLEIIELDDLALSDAVGGFATDVNCKVGCDTDINCKSNCGSP